MIAIRVTQRNEKAMAPVSATPVMQEVGVENVIPVILGTSVKIAIWATTRLDLLVLRGIAPPLAPKPESPMAFVSVCLVLWGPAVRTVPLGIQVQPVANVCQVTTWMETMGVWRVFVPHMELKQKLVVHASAKLDSLVLSVTGVTLLTTGLTIIAMVRCSS